MIYFLSAHYMDINALSKLAFQYRKPAIVWDDK